MQLTYSDIVGSLGVFILLLSFALNLLGKISAKGLLYILLNIVGAGLSCYASYLIKYTPFIILEAAWTIVSIIAFANYLRK